MANPPAAFGEALAALPPERFASFVADLWQARGWSVEREGAVLRVTDGPVGGDRVLFPRAAGDARSIPDGVDVIVAAGDPDGLDVDARLVGPQAVYEIVRYGLEGRDSDRLATDYLGDAEVLERPTPDAADDADATEGADTPDGDEAEPAEPARGFAGSSPGFLQGPEEEVADGEPARSGRPTRRTLLLGGGAFLAGLATAAASGLGPFGSVGGSVRGTPTPSPPADVAVPGLSADGVEDPRALAVAHADRLTDTSFTVATTKTLHAADGRLLSSFALDTRIGESRSFRVDVATAGPEGRPLFGERPASAELWSDRETYLRRVSTDEGTSYTEYSGRGEINEWYYWSSIVPFGGQPYSELRFYRDLFGVVPADVMTDGAPPYRLQTADASLESAPIVFGALNNDDPVRRLDLLATVTPAGLVRSLSMRYVGTYKGAPVTVGWSIDYRALGETTVSRPDWADRAQEA